MVILFTILIYIVSFAVCIPLAYIYARLVTYNTYYLKRVFGRMCSWSFVGPVGVIVLLLGIILFSVLRFADWYMTKMSNMIDKIEF